MPDSGMADIVDDYVQRFGWRVIPLRGKQPRDTQWEDGLPADQLRQAFTSDPALGAGAVLGAASGGLVDADVDAHGMDYHKVRQLADAYLPPSDWQFGRKSKPNSHRFYRCAMVPKLMQCKGPLGMIIELRSSVGGSHAQTMIPPSVHPSGEQSEWDLACPLVDGPPYRDAGEIRRGIHKTAIGAYLLSVFPKDGHDARLALCGWLAFQGWPEAEVLSFVAAVMDARGHGSEDVQATVASTFHRLANGEPIKGFPALKHALSLDKMMTGSLRRWEAEARPEGAKPLGAGMVFTDYGVAGALVFDCTDDVRWASEQGCWYSWAEKRWVPDASHRANVCVAEGLRKIRSNLPPGDDEKQREKKVKALLSMETRAKTESILSFMESDLEVRVDQFDADPWLLNCQNGILDLKAGTIERHSPSRLQVSIAAAEYDPSASAPVFEKFITEMFPDGEVRGFVQRLLGYCLTGLVREHVFPIFYGPGRNGKSTLLGSMTDMLGTYAGPIPAAVVTMSRNKSDRHPTELAAFFKKRLAVTAESEQGKRLDESAVKNLTGGDTISVRQMKEDPWDLRPTHKLILMTNYVPQVWGHDEGIWRRLIFIPCEVQFKGVHDNVHLREQLRGEFSGILNWCLRGLKGYQAHGLSVPLSIVAHAQEYRENQDEVLPFLDEKYMVTGVHTDRVPAAELYMAYRTWCAMQGAEVLSAKSLAPQYRGYGLRQYRTNTAMYWSGIRAKTKEELEDKGEKIHAVV